MERKLKKTLLILVIILFIEIFIVGYHFEEINDINKKGTITIENIDFKTKVPIKGSEYSIIEIKSNTVVDKLITNNNGKATSAPLSYYKKYKIKQVRSPEYYQTSEDEHIIEIKSNNNDVIFENKVFDYIKDYERLEDGSLNIKKVYMPVETILQNPQLPNGCEITSLTALLNYYNYEVEKVEMADKYLDKKYFYHKDGKLYGPNPHKAFVGDPSDANGWFSFPSPIIDAANRYFNDISQDKKAINISNSSKEELRNYINRGIPIIIWVTIDMQKGKFNYSWYLSGSKEYFKAPTNLHTVVIKGYVDDKIYAMDPLRGHVIYDEDTLIQRYYEIGSYAMIIEEK